MPQPTLIHDSLTAAAARTPDKAFLVCGETTWSYAQVDAASTALAGGLIEGGVRPGEKVAILLDNAAETVISLYGVSKAAATCSFFMTSNWAMHGRNSVSVTAATASWFPVRSPSPWMSYSPAAP